MNITIPNGFEPRPYQRNAMRHFDRGGKRGIYCWPRRAGKDLTFVHQTMKAAHERPGMYFHLLPNHKQARKVIWDAIDNEGRRVIDIAIPKELRESTNEQEMKIKLKVGSMYQLVGADYFDSIVGSNPVGLVFSEFALTDPRAWSYFRPILAANGGWAAFISTPRGYNHFHDMLEIAKKSPEWGWSHLTVHDTGHIDMSTLEQERREMPDELFRQEYLTDFSAANVGAILGRYIEDAEKQGRISDDVDPDGDGADIEISCDIGFRDTAAFWFWQPKRNGYSIIDYDADNGIDAQDWIDRLQEKPYRIARIWLPHDARAKTFQSRHSVVEQFARAFGTDKVKIVPQTKVQDRINAARVVAPRCEFHRSRTQMGLQALRAWSFAWDDERKTFGKMPEHDWASHGGDAFSYGAVVMRERMAEEKPKGFVPPRNVNEITLDELWMQHENIQESRI